MYEAPPPNFLTKNLRQINARNIIFNILDSLGYNSRWQYGSIFIRNSLAVVASQICKIRKIHRKFELIAVQGHPRAWILVSMESAYMQLPFPLVIDNNFERVCYRCRDIDAFSSKIVRFPHPTLIWDALAEERPAMSMQSTQMKSTFRP